MAERRTRKDGEPDRRGGGTAHPQPHGGRIGNPPFVPTDQQRAEVRALAQIFPPHAQHHIAIRLDISEDTLSRHFRYELARGRADMLAAVGAQMIKRAIHGANAEGVTGDPDMQKFIMARLGGWGRVEVTGPGGGPIQTIDLSRLNAEQFYEYGRLSAIAEGIDPDSIEIIPLDRD